MKRKTGKKLSCFLCAFCLFLTGCGTTQGLTETAESGEEKTTGMSGMMGRYMEDISPLPEGINRNGGLNFMEDGSLTIISYNGGCYRSKDGGKSFEREEADWFPLIENVYCQSAVMAPDGSVAAACSGTMSEEVRAVCTKPVPDDWEGSYCVFVFPEGEAKAVDFGFSQDQGNNIVSFRFKEDGRLFAGDASGKVYEVDMEKEKLTELFASDRAVGYMDFSGDVLMAVGHDRLYLYDLTNQMLLSQDETVDAFLKKQNPDGAVSYTGGGYPVSVCGGEDGIIYIACRDGLYRHALGGSMMEQIIDGALSSFGDAIIYTVTEIKDQEFLALFEPSAGMVRYTFDESVPAMPDKEIRIYSLEENGTLRRAITSYKKEHTDMYVRYEVGMKDEDGETAEDAVKKLNTQILAGEGPDVMLLDGLPVNSYKEKGILMDLGGTLEKLSGENTLFPNLIEGAAEESGEIYAMPMCVRVPLLAGETVALTNMNDLKSFADGMEELRKQNPEGGILGIYDEEGLLKLFGTVSCGAWTKEDGGIDKEAIEEFLEQTKRIYEAELSGAVEEERETLLKEDEEMRQYGEDASEMKKEICENVLNIPRGYARVSCGYVESIQLCLDNVTSVLRLDGNMSYKIFNGQEQDVFLPKNVIGINAKTERKEEAEEFVLKMFGKEAQDEIYDGFPVNQAAFADAFDFYEPNAGNGSMTFMSREKTEIEFSLYWPDEEEERAFTEIMKELKKPVWEDEWLSELVYEVGTEVLEGNLSAEEGAEEIEKKAAVYLAE